MHFNHKNPTYIFFSFVSHFIIFLFRQKEQCSAISYTAFAYEEWQKFISKIFFQSFYHFFPFTFSFWYSVYIKIICNWNINTFYRRIMKLIVFYISLLLLFERILWWFDLKNTYFLIEIAWKYEKCNFNILHQW